MNATATVEVLTAEVRVLMVGSRQVTLSVYNQLDWISHSQIVPFGRVNPRDANQRRVYVVGKDIRSGVLARAINPRAEDDADLVDSSVTDGLMRNAFAAVFNLSDEATEESFSVAMNAAGNILARFTLAKLLPLGRAKNLFDSLARRTAAKWLPREYALDWLVGRINEIGNAHDVGTASELEMEAIAIIARRDEIVATCASTTTAWSELPLIVLAGLR